MKSNAKFWITNISKMNVCLSDLQLVVPAGRSWNLLDKKHFSYSLDQLEKSAKEGSIFKKNDKIKVRNIPPEELVKPGLYTAVNDFREIKLRSLVKIEEKRYEELDSDLDPRVAEEKHATEFAALDAKFFEENKK